MDANNQKFYIVLLVLILAFFIFIKPKLMGKEQFYQGLSRPVPSGLYNYTLGLDNDLKVDMLPCSKKCCGRQWPVSFDLEDSGMEEVNSKDITSNHENLEDGAKYITSNMYCRGNRLTSGSGCVCLPKKARNILNNRGGNSFSNE